MARILPYCKGGERLTNEQVEELAGLVEEGLIFVSRADHPVYVKHISFQLDLVLVDKNLNETEIADISSEALAKMSVVLNTTDCAQLYEYLYDEVMGRSSRCSRTRRSKTSS